MGAVYSDQAQQNVKPLDIDEFRAFAGPTDQHLIPEVPEKRKVTDFKFTVTFAACILILVPFLIYSYVYSDVNRLVPGHDNCGNVCGKNNSYVEGISCSGKDNTNLPLLKYEYVPEVDESSSKLISILDYECVKSCDSSLYVIFMHQCFPIHHHIRREFYAELDEELNRSTGYIVALCFIGLGFSVGLLFLFRYFVAVVVWFILVASVTGFVILTIVLWVVHDSNSSNSWPIISTLVSIASVLMLMTMVKRVQLVIRLFKEAIKTIFGIPLILLEPLLTFLAATIVLVVIFYVFLPIFATAGNLEAVGFNKYKYVPNGVVWFTMFFCIIISLWMLQFITGCQQMVISGAVSAYYFARDKSTLVAPIYYSFYNLLRYHLGTVAFGSLIINIIAIIKGLLRFLAQKKLGELGKVLVDCCVGTIEDILKAFSKQAYILTAMHGQPFYKSGKRAVRLLAANALSTIAVNSVGDFVLHMAKLLVVLCTVGVGYLMKDDSVKHFGVVIFIPVIVTGIIANSFFTVFETTVDTIFLCFCEDNCMNDGVDRPYYMTTSLMQYVEDAKKAMKDED